MIYTFYNKKRKYSTCITEYIVIEQQEPRFNVCKNNFCFKRHNSIINKSNT